MTIHARHELLRDMTRRTLDSAVSTGDLVRAGRWYLTPDEIGPSTVPLARGMRATCLTAARYHGLWTPSTSRIHAYGIRRQGAPSGWVPHGYHHRWPEAGPVASVPLLLRHASACVGPLDLGVLVDSALNQRKLADGELEALLRHAPRAAHPVLHRVTPAAQSGTESKVRLFLQLRRVPVVPQAQLEGIGRVDLLVGASWIIECDSKEHHTSFEQYGVDRGRDLSGRVGGYLTTRLTHEMVTVGWADTRAHLLSILRTGQHLVPPQRRAVSRRRVRKPSS